MAEPSDQLEAVRKAMLELLDQNHDATHATLERKLLFAHNIEDLWYARPELMNAIAASQGEAAAQAGLTRITLMFKAGRSGKPQASKRPVVPKR